MSEETFKELVEDMKREVEEKRRQHWETKLSWEWADILGYGDSYRYLVSEVGEHRAEEIEEKVSRS